MSLTDPAPWLLLVAAAHLGFQATVTVMVYPALRDVAPDDWTRSHTMHSRRIVSLVGVLYLPLVALLGWAALTHASEPATWLAMAGGVLSVGTTAAVAAPLHGQLGGAVSRDDRVRLTRRLLAADRVRALGALVCLVGAVWLAA